MTKPHHTAPHRLIHGPRQLLRAPEPAPPPAARILVVDDDESVRLVFVELLRREGFQVIEARNGREALGIAREQRPDLVLLDVRMPGLNGYEVCKQIKADPKLPDTFVVLVSGQTTDESPESWGLNTGADEYIVKPVRPHEFLARVKFTLRLRETTVALRSALELNKTLTKRIIAAQEEERQRVARDLHDGVNQILASAKMRLQTVFEQCAGAIPPSSREVLHRCGRMLAQALEENRRIAHNLRPNELDQLGLPEACRGICTRFGARTGIPVACNISQSRRRFHPELEMNVFRILQEALNNVEKHSGADHVWMRLGIQKNTVSLTVVDDGRGFHYSGDERSKQGGIGLDNMRERAAALGAKLEVVSSPGAGTSINVVVELAGKKKPDGKNGK